MALHAARRIALQRIYASMLGSQDCESVLEGSPDYQGAVEDQGFVDDALAAFSEKQTEFDRIIQDLSPKRALERIPMLDRAILYLALFELSQKGALPGVVINEAVELAKRFGEEADSRFINGVLGNYHRQQTP